METVGNGGLWNNYGAGGGAGNPGGKGVRGSGWMATGENGENGTGGLLVIYADILNNENLITSEGMHGGAGYMAGGSSGGGSINIFANKVLQYNDVKADGGIAASGMRANPAGDGTITVNELGAVLNYPEKEITLEIGKSYGIENSKLSYTELNDIQTENLSVGSIKYEPIDGSGIISINSTGVVTGEIAGKTKVKIIDETNGKSTYIIVNVVEERIKSKIEIGDTFTLTLKENGTVWTFGDNGAIKTNEPTQIMLGTDELLDIVDIGAGDKTSIAVNKNGEVYTWGGSNKIPTKENSLSSIIAVDAYKDKFYAIDENGNAYEWESGSAPTRVNSNIKYKDVNGELLLGQNGLLYNINEPEQRIKYLSGIAKLAFDEKTYSVLDLEGMIHSVRNK